MPEESASEAWTKLVQHYQDSGLKGRRRLTIALYVIKMELGEHPRKSLLHVDETVKELKRFDRPVNTKDINIVILSGLTPQYDAEVRMLESWSDRPREWIERAMISQYERLECVKSAAWSRAMLSARGLRCNDNPPIRCPLCTRTGPSVLQYRKYQTTRCEKKPNGYHGDGEHSGNGGGGGNDPGGRNGGGGGNGGGVGGNRGGGGSKYRSRGGGKQNKSSKDSEFGDKTARPDCYFCLRFHIVSKCTNLGAGLLVATSARPTLAARGAPRERHEDQYLVEDSGAIENMTQDSSNFEDYAPPPPEDEVESASGVFLPVGGCGRLRLLVD